MFKKRANSVLSEYKIFIKLVLRDFERLQKYSTKSVSLGSPNKGLNCEGEILAYKLCLISILYIKNTNEECFIGF